MVLYNKLQENWGSRPQKGRLRSRHRDRVWKQISGLFVCKNENPVLCHHGVAGQSIYWCIDKGQY